MTDRPDVERCDTFPKVLLYNAGRRGDRPAVREKDYGIWQSWTWSAVADEVRALACGLAALGFKPGDMLVIVGDNRPQLYWAMVAAQALGGVPVPVAEATGLGLRPEHLALVRGGMNDVVNGKRGTARRSRIADEAMAMAGKTGTSQVYSISKAERAQGVTKTADLPWKLRDHALFVSYAPVEAPRYAVAVVVEHGGGGSKVAAPIARDIMMRALYGPEVPLRAYPPGQRPERAPTPVQPRPEAPDSGQPRIRT